MFSIVLEAGMFMSHWIWMFRFRKVRNEAKDTGKSIEELSTVPMERPSPLPAWLNIQPFTGSWARLSRMCKGARGVESQEESRIESQVGEKEYSKGVREI
jgi:hypothetical protein